MPGAVLPLKIDRTVNRGGANLIPVAEARGAQVARDRDAQALLPVDRHLTRVPGAALQGLQRSAAIGPQRRQIDIRAHHPRDPVFPDHIDVQRGQCRAHRGADVHRIAGHHAMVERQRTAAAQGVRADSFDHPRDVRRDHHAQVIRPPQALAIGHHVSAHPRVPQRLHGMAKLNLGRQREIRVPHRRSAPKVDPAYEVRIASGRPQLQVHAGSPQRAGHGAARVEGAVHTGHAERLGLHVQVSHARGPLRRTIQPVHLRPKLRALGSEEHAGRALLPAQRSVHAIPAAVQIRAEPRRQRAPGWPRQRAFDVRHGQRHRAAEHRAARGDQAAGQVQRLRARAQGRAVHAHGDRAHVDVYAQPAPRRPARRRQIPHRDRIHADAVVAA